MSSISHNNGVFDLNQINIFNRPLCVFNNLFFQAGPLIVYGGKPVYEQSIIKGKFKYDAVRLTSHLVLGYDKENQLIVVWVKRDSMKNLAQKLINFGVVNGMNMDGGHSAYLTVGTEHRGHKLKVPVGIDLYRK